MDEVEGDAGDDEEGDVLGVGDLHGPATTYLFFLILHFKFRADGDRDRADGDRRGEDLRGDVRFGEDFRLPFVSHASNVKCWATVLPLLLGTSTSS